MSKPPQYLDPDVGSCRVLYLEPLKPRPVRPAPVTDAELAEFRRLLPMMQAWERERAALLCETGCPVMKHILTK